MVRRAVRRAASKLENLSRQIQAHHYAARINQDVLQCAVYDSDAPSAHLIGEQKLWHSHAYEVKSGVFMCPRMPEVMQRQELKGLAKTYDGHGSRDDKYKVSSEGIKESRKEMAEPLRVNTNADYWRLHGKGFAVDVVQTDMQAPALGCL
ncbi:hypothetical protein C4D60_Mb09t00050 [Musa balbisiana]|uniref:Uncharacterized protein n=1 Tax=Musa balbisiana TaxID=52838 RepID=A0A4S8ICX1_MUSBA|nr:hypothetical protein C4D60_Mb09t00050 [Musa balbisiana]